MKTYTILARSLEDTRSIRQMGEVKCKTSGEARQWAMINCWPKLGNEQMIVASPEQLKHWKKDFNF